jgi:UDPglucose 6-dehydrogenase
MREAPSLTLVEQLLEAGCTVTAYDPVAMDEAKRRMGDSISYASDIYEAVKDADVLFHITEWQEFRMPDWSRIKSLMNSPS